MPQDENQNQSGLLNLDELQSEFTFEVPKSEDQEDLPPVPELNLEATAEEPEKEKDVVKEEPKLVTKTEKSNYSVRAQALIEAGEWEDAETDLEDGTTVKLSEYDDLNEEQYKDLLAEYKKIKEEQLNSKYLKVENVDEDKKRIASIVLNGGDLREIFKNPQELVRPFSEELGWDLDNENHQAAIVYQQYLAQGLSESEAGELVEKARKNLELDDRSKQIVNFHQKNHSEKLKRVEVDLIQEMKDEEDRIKNYRKDLSKEYKDLGLEDSLIKRLINSATNKTDKGDFHIDSLYEERMRDPKKAKDLILFLEDEEKFLKLKNYQTEKDVKVSTLRKISLIPKGRERGSTETEDKSKETFVFDLPPKN
jgi:hypothetical protein